MASASCLLSSAVITRSWASATMAFKLLVSTVRTSWRGLFAILPNSVSKSAYLQERLGPYASLPERHYLPSSTPIRRLRMRLVSLRPELCLQLPSYPASRRRSCCSARSFRLSGPPEDFQLHVTSEFAFARWLLAEVATPNRSTQASTRDRPTITGQRLCAMPGAQTKKRTLSSPLYSSLSQLDNRS